MIGYTVSMYILSVLALFCVPLSAFAHGSGAVVPLPVPVTMALYAGIAAVLVTFFISMRIRTVPLVHRYGVPVPLWSVQLLSVFLLSVLLASYVYEVTGFFVWFVIMTLGVTICAVITFEELYDARRFVGFSFAPVLLIVLFVGEFFVPAFQTSQSLFSILFCYILVFIVLGMASGVSILRHELFTRLLITLGSAAPIKVFTQPKRPHAHLPQFVDTILISTLIIATTFDGLLHSAYWRSIQEAFQLGEGNMFVGALVFCAAVALFVLFYFVALVLMRDDIGAGDEYTLVQLARTFTPIFVPIAVGYVVAHNITRIPQMFEPEVISYTWGLQLMCIIAGHIWSVFLSHAIAHDFFGSESRVRRSQVSMAVFMVIITGVSILMLQAPI